MCWRLCAVACLLVAQLGVAEVVPGQALPQDTVETANSTDPRQLVTMPEEAREMMRKDMLDHLAVINEVLGYMGDNNLDAAAELMEMRLGRSSMGKHRVRGMGPGRFMPLEMRNLSWSMHQSASEFALISKQGDLSGAYKALQKVTTSCVVCHYSYRAR
ncbi:hypothetical protein MIB92_00245 [Aestuariirhabdus sp. Z084]|uniref:hypothetical protein n=1 Tax=Aestuariirhabdus haliotis TaxID=2918751 RepID=UPI00201B35CB|nr:hypothetical protein [Aestuariirhabdus haliotis]MCL6414065.1 hypothetical protein [Aestuariirhabdus haliotis]MCL6417998.1 hypothetical protein [Aestuariirhabdus haliotis]